MLFSKQKVKELEFKIKVLEEDLGSIVELFGKESFKEDWEEFQKWKLMKERIPEFDDLVEVSLIKQRLNDVKMLNEELNRAKAAYWAINLGSFEKRHKRYGAHTRQVSQNFQEALSVLSEMNDEYFAKINKITSQISEAADTIRKKYDENEIIEFCKLYSIDSSWILPKIIEQK